MQNPSTGTRRAVTKNLASIVLAFTAPNQLQKQSLQLAALIKQRLTDSLDWLEQHGITGETAIFFISLMQQGGAE